MGLAKSSERKLSEAKLDKLDETTHIETTDADIDGYDSIELTDTGKVTWFISGK